MKNLLFLVMIIVGVPFAKAQKDTIFINRYYRWCDKTDAIEYAFVNRNNKDIVVSFFTMQGVPTWTSSYAAYEKNKRIRNGKAVLLYPSGQKKKVNFWKMNRMDGEQFSYFENGNTERYEIYKNGYLVSGKRYDKEGKEIPYPSINKAAEYPQGDKALNEYIRKSLEKTSISGNENREVTVSLFIDKDGNITNYEIGKGATETLNKEALRIAGQLKKMSKKEKWIPAVKEGITEDVIYPVSFLF